jgi:hypothetical protein
MAKPQQPEIARSGRGAVDPSAVKEQLTAPTTGGGENGDLGPIPEDQRPGHHPTVEQDKPSGEAFLEKLHEHASSTEASASAEDDDAGEPEHTSERADRLAEAVGKPF